MSHGKKKVLFRIRMDSGDNVFVANRKEYFHHLVSKKVDVELAIGQHGYFAGVGMVLTTASETPGFLFILYPTFHAPRDLCCTVSNGSFTWLLTKSPSILGKMSSSSIVLALNLLFHVLPLSSTRIFFYVLTLLTPITST